MTLWPLACRTCRGTGVEHYTVGDVKGAQPCPDCTPKTPAVSPIARVLQERRAERQGRS